MDASTSWAQDSIEDYAERTAETKKMWQSMNGQQAGDPAKLADALLKVIDLDRPPLRFVAGDDALPAVEAKGKEIAEQATASRALGTGLSHEDAA
ncbi:short-chain dehydrogenase/reductase SDR [Streptomyces albogriseolus]|uniref:short-chain dehydrogenase/reductase SDR n=1 Tax=Streptomyces TaxID=1883 RepID=UPI0034987846